MNVKISITGHEAGTTLWAVAALFRNEDGTAQLTVSAVMAKNDQQAIHRHVLKSRAQTPRFRNLPILGGAAHRVIPAHANS